MLGMGLAMGGCGTSAQGIGSLHLGAGLRVPESRAHVQDSRYAGRTPDSWTGRKADSCRLWRSCLVHNGNP